MKRGSKLSEEHRRKLSIAQKARFAKSPIWNKGKPGTRLGAVLSEETKQRMRRAAAGRGNHNWLGGKSGDAVAAILIPLGFIREFQIPVGHNRHRGQYQMDFARLVDKIDIELDSPRHAASPEFDKERDLWLNELGWRVLRIKHGKGLDWVPSIPKILAEFLAAEQELVNGQTEK